MTLLAEYGIGQETDPDPPPKEESLPCVKGRKTKHKKGGNKRMAEAIYCEVNGMVDRNGVNRVLWYTQTFAAPIYCRKEAQRAYKYFHDKFLKYWVKEAVAVFERDQKGAIHFHAVISPREEGDFAGKFDHEAFNRADGSFGVRKLNLTARYGRSATPALRAFWARLDTDEVRERFNIGRATTTPLDPNRKPKGLARYLAKYITKSVKLESDKRWRVVRFLGIGKKDGQEPRTRYSSGWGWVTKGARIQRAKFAWIGRFLLGIPETEVVNVLGSKWAFVFGSLSYLVPLWAIPPDLRQTELLARHKQAVRLQMQKVEQATEYLPEFFAGAVREYVLTLRQLAA